METKQVIVMLRFPNLRIGKYCAQASHASLGAYIECYNLAYHSSEVREITKNWLQNSFTKIVTYVDSEMDLLDIQEKCILSNIPCKLIVDSGATEFKGIPTITALGIGPWLNTELDKITRNLKLF